MLLWKILRLLLPVLLFFAQTAWASIFIDPEDGSLDGSRWLIERRGFLPVPIIITEPAVGYGLGVALVFMDKDEPIKKPALASHAKFAPPIITAVAAAYTQNGTKFGGVFHKRSWQEDEWRYLGGLALMSINLQFYGLNGSGLTQYLPPLKYNLDGFALVQEVRRRVFDSSWYLGLRYLYMDITSSFDNDFPAFIPEQKEKIKNGGLALVANFDDRDNTLTPEHGYQAEFRYYFFDHAFGSDRSYQLGVLDLTGYWRFHENWGAAGRFLLKNIKGDSPFYAKPFINIRGVAKMRYQGDIAASSEAELRWNPQDRWQYLAFVGAGKADTEIRNNDTPSSATAYGLGFRYLIARLFGFKMGIDIAKGPEETVWYIQAGSAWF